MAIFVKIFSNMTAIAVLPIKTATPQTPKRISWEDFKRRYLSRDDEYTYEWVNGQVEKTKRAMDYSQVFIMDNLLNFFEQLKNQGKVTGRLAVEVDTLFLKNHRRPDICYLSQDQIKASRNGDAPLPEFVIEIISNNDKAKRVQTKMLDYWRAEVPVIWHIYPDLEIVHIYHGRNMAVLMGEEICSAAPILPDFALSVKDIFK
jgi:Uma2 family endonuclease